MADLDYDTCALRDRIIGMRAHTDAGRAARAAVALRLLAETFADEVGDRWAKTVIRAAEAGMPGSLELSLPVGRAAGEAWT